MFSDELFQVSLLEEIYREGCSSTARNTARTSGNPSFISVKRLFIAQYYPSSQPQLNLTCKEY